MFVDNVKNLNIVMPMYNLLEYSNIYSMTAGSLWNYYRDEINNDENENGDNGNKINNNKTIASKSFKYKTKLIGSTSDNASTPFFNKQSTFDPRPKNCLSFSKKLPQKIV